MIDLNVCTMAIPRLLVGRCLRSFLESLQDRDKFRLTWYVLLDRYHKLNQYFDETLDQIQDVMTSFDAWHWETATYQYGFGNAARLLFNEALRGNDTLWIEDDWLWEKPFRLSDALDVTDDCFTFVGGKTCAGAMHPSIWRRHVIAHLLANFPENLGTLHEGTIAKVVSPHFSVARHPNITGKVCRHIGDEQMAKLGFSHNWCGQKFEGRKNTVGLTQGRHRPRYRNGEWVQQ